jgi:hypothetical protein
MANNITVKFKGTETVKKNLDKWEKKKLSSLEDECKKTGFDIERDAKMTVPVMYGYLKASLTTSWPNGPDYSNIHGIKRPSTEIGVFRVVIGTNVPYAHIQEFGYWGDAPKPIGGDRPPKRGHIPRKRPASGFLYLTKAYHKNRSLLKGRLKSMMSKSI